ncbi:MAG: cyclic pyranopterin monophosphate synthase MoaC [bacterium]|nr:cyclic pyranopterin monophosphate synthase MoaC [bacterium]
MNELTHFDEQGRPKMVDVRQKEITSRLAKAQATVLMKKETIELIRDKKIQKGDVLSVATTAGILAAKRTSELIPMCHSLMIESCKIDWTLNEDKIVVESEVSLCAKTGVEMEALMAVSVAALTVYDMCKSVDRGIIISDICLIKKAGGKSGAWEKF